MLSFFATFVGSLRHSTSTAMINSTLGQYLGTTMKLGPLAKSEACACISDLDDRFWTYMTMMPLGVGEFGLPDAVTVDGGVVWGGGVVAVELLEPEAVLGVLEFDWPPLIIYIF